MGLWARSTDLCCFFLAAGGEMSCYKLILACEGINMTALTQLDIGCYNVTHQP